VDAILERKGLSRFFSAIITRTEVVNSKPHPESYELCLKLLGLQKDECIVFEDTVNGIKSAKAAGLVCYAIQSNTSEHYKLGDADKIFVDFNEAKNHLLG
jgi:beta-phosphoglucomutase